MYTRVPCPEPSSLLPPCTIPLGGPSAPAPSTQYRTSNLDWRLISYMILYMFQCHSPKSSHPLPLPQNPKDCWFFGPTFYSSISARFPFCEDWAHLFDLKQHRHNKSTDTRELHQVYIIHWDISLSKYFEKNKSFGYIWENEKGTMEKQVNTGEKKWRCRWNEPHGQNIH